MRTAARGGGAAARSTHTLHLQPPPGHRLVTPARPAHPAGVRAQQRFCSSTSTSTLTRRNPVPSAFASLKGVAEAIYGGKAAAAASPDANTEKQDTPPSPSHSGVLSPGRAIADDVLRTSWPWEKMEHNLSTQGKGMISRPITTLADDGSEVRIPITGFAPGVREFKQMLMELHGDKEGLRIYFEELVPRMKQLYSASVPGRHASIPDAFPERATEEFSRGKQSIAHRASEEPLALSAQEILYLMSGAEKGGGSSTSDKLRDLLLWKLGAGEEDGEPAGRGMTLYVPMQEMSFGAMFDEFSEDMIPEEFQGMAGAYKEMLEAQGSGPADMQPAFSPLPGREGDPDAPMYLPVFLTQGGVEAHIRHVIQHTPQATASITFATAGCNALLEQIADAPDEVILGLNHGMGSLYPADPGTPFTGSLWLAKPDQRRVLKSDKQSPPQWASSSSSSLGNIFAGMDGVGRQERQHQEHQEQQGAVGEAFAGEEGDASDDSLEAVALREAQKELQALLDDMVSLLKCLRRSVRFAYIASSQIDAETEIYRIGLEMSTPENDPNFANSLQVLSPPTHARKKRRRKLKRMTPRQLLLFKVRHAERLVKQKPVDDLIHTEEVDRPELRRVSGGRRKGPRFYRVRWTREQRRARRLRRLAERREAGAVHEADTRWREQIYPYSHVVKQLKERPVLSHLIRRSFVSFDEVADGGRGAVHFAGASPFFDNTLEYAGVERALKEESSLEEDMRDDYLQQATALMKEHQLETFTTLRKLRETEGATTGDMGVLRDEQVFLTEKQQLTLMLGPHWSRNSATRSDKRFNETRRQFYMLTGRKKDAAALGPAGYTYRQGVADDTKCYESYLYDKRGGERRNEDRPDHDDLHGLSHMARDERVLTKSQELGVDVEEITFENTHERELREYTARKKGMRIR